LRHILPGRFVNIIDTYREVIAAGEKIAACQVQGHYWQDIGTPKDYLEIHQRLLSGELPSLTKFFPSIIDPCLATGVLLREKVDFGGAVTIGPGARIGAGARLRNTVIWAEATVDPGVELTDCIVSQGARVMRSGQGECFV
jgi:mannose-1-phosphate guanylyltransferase